MFFVGINEATTTAPLEREVGNSIDELLEDDTADPQFSEQTLLDDKEERRDDVVPPRVSAASDLSVLAVERFLRCLFLTMPPRSPREGVLLRGQGRWLGMVVVWCYVFGSSYLEEIF